MTFPNLITTALSAPVVAVDPDRPEVLHAVTMERVVKDWPRDGDGGRYTMAACGLAFLKILGNGPHPVLWPPRVASLPEGWTRCKACHDATGRKRPRWVLASEDPSG